MAVLDNISGVHAKNASVQCAKLGQVHKTVHVSEVVLIIFNKFSP